MFEPSSRHYHRNATSPVQSRLITTGPVGLRLAHDPSGFRIVIVDNKDSSTNTGMDYVT